MSSSTTRINFEEFLCVHFLSHEIVDVNRAFAVNAKLNLSEICCFNFILKHKNN